MVQNAPGLPGSRAARASLLGGGAGIDDFAVFASGVLAYLASGGARWMPAINATNYGFYVGGGRTTRPINTTLFIADPAAFAASWRTFR